MKSYQEAYLALLREAAEERQPSPEGLEPEAFVEEVRAAGARARRRIAQGTQLLRCELFPTLDNILAASQGEVDALCEFAGELMKGRTNDVALNYRIHLALMNYARQKNLRDMLIRELYQLGMALHYLETTLQPSCVRLYSTRMRMYFAEAASYFETAYDEIEDPETRGYIHRSMGNIALSYEGNNPETAHAKLRAIDRSIRILSDPDVQAKTPSLPWQLYLYKSHQERTSMLSYLRTGNAEADVFAQVLESAQIVQQRQTRAARESGAPLQPRWQYAYFAARYHCGAMLLPELLDGLYALSTAQPDDDFSYQSLFSHVSIPALFMEYAKELRDEHQLQQIAPRVRRLTDRAFQWLARMTGDDMEISFALRQFLYAYREVPGGTPFFEAVQNVFAAVCPDSYAQMWIVGQLSRLLCEWVIEDCPERLVGLLDCADAQEVAERRAELLDFAATAGRLCDTGMVHFFNVESTACRGLFEEEQALLQLHAYCGSELLACHKSTAAFADVAHGHHCYYNERGGYPLSFSPRNSPVRAMIYLVGAASTLAASAKAAGGPLPSDEDIDRAAAELIDGEGGRCSPFIAAALRAPERRELLRRSMAFWSREACVDLFHRRERMLSPE